MKIVIDTNVIVSAFMNASGIPAVILASVLNGKATIIYDNRIIFEYVDVLSREKFGFAPELVHNIIGYFRSAGEYVGSRPSSRKGR